MLHFYDTSTEPTPAMIEAMARAELGDDVYHSDPTVNKLERLGHPCSATPTPSTCRPAPCPT